MDGSQAAGAAGFEEPFDDPDDVDEPFDDEPLEEEPLEEEPPVEESDEDEELDDVSAGFGVPSADDPFDDPSDDPFADVRLSVR